MKNLLVTPEMIMPTLSHEEIDFSGQSKLYVGQSASIERCLSAKDILSFADATGDYNPLHLNEEYAKTTQFGEPIAHGLWAASMFSNILGTKLPGAGTVYLEQTLQFKAPVKIGDTIKAVVTCQAIREDKPIARFECRCINQYNKVVVFGEAVVMVPAIRLN